MAAHILLLPLFAPFPVSVHSVMSQKMCAITRLGSVTAYKDERECQNWGKWGCDWEKVTHLTIMLGGGPYSAGSDFTLENMVPFSDISVKKLASMNAFLFGRGSWLLGSALWHSSRLSSWRLMLELASTWDNTTGLSWYAYSIWSIFIFHLKSI